MGLDQYIALVRSIVQAVHPTALVSASPDVWPDQPTTHWTTQVILANRTPNPHGLLANFPIHPDHNRTERAEAFARHLLTMIP